MLDLVPWYLASIVLLWVCHRLPGWARLSDSDLPTGKGRFDRWQRRLLLRKHEPRLVADIVMSGLGYLLIYASTTPRLPLLFDGDSSDYVIALFAGIGFSLLIVALLGGNIAVNRNWSRSYLLLPIYFAHVIIAFARLYTVLGMRDDGKVSKDYATAVYLSMITIANLGSGDVIPSRDARFVAVTESFVGYAALAFLAAVMFTTLQRWMRSQSIEYEKRRKALELAETSDEPSARP
jgi:ion channel